MPPRADHAGESAYLLGVGMMTAVRVGADTDVAELCEALGNLSQRAQREFPKVGNDALATPWDLRHVAINETLDLWELARG